jgi:hypothetical protein
MNFEQPELLLAVGMASLVIVVSLWILRRQIVDFFRALRARHLTAANEGNVQPVDKTATVLIVFALSLSIIVLISMFDVTEQVQGANDFTALVVGRSVEIILGLMAICWVSVSLPYRSPVTRAGTAATLGILLYVMMALVINQTQATFILALCIIGFIGIRELSKHLLNQPTLTAIAQSVLVVFTLAVGLYTFFSFILPALESELSVRLFNFAFRLRYILMALFTSFILIATAVNTLRVFQLTHEVLVNWQSSSFLLDLIVPHITTLVNGTFSVAHNVLRFLGIVAQEAWRFTKEVVVDKSLWLTLLNIIGIAVSSFLLAWIIVFVKPHLGLVLKRTAVWYEPDTQVLISNICIWLGFIFSFLLVLLIAVFWLPREVKQETRRAVENKIQDGAVIIFLCIFFSTFTYFHLFVPMTEWNSPLVFPGIYTLAVVVLAIASFWWFRTRGSLQRSSPDSGAGSLDSQQQPQA